MRTVYITFDAINVIHFTCRKARIFLREMPPVTIASGSARRESGSRRCLWMRIISAGYLSDFYHCASTRTIAGVLTCDANDAFFKVHIFERFLPSACARGGRLFLDNNANSRSAILSAGIEPTRYLFYITLIGSSAVCLGPDIAWLDQESAQAHLTSSRRNRVVMPLRRSTKCIRAQREL